MVPQGNGVCDRECANEECYNDNWDCCDTGTILDARTGNNAAACCVPTQPGAYPTPLPLLRVYGFRF